ncbi:hypothetical protein PBAT_18630 [Paenibacillus antarcticus]|uniref:Uncharacterized protein n=1 Tax=Paenibacillus antarcticus TaxID=253703 RepID=A0A168LFJ4_9BACL|nr:hypothetical protein PBAT_18630 [Paenibacillus antarcticus]
MVVSALGSATIALKLFSDAIISGEILSVIKRAFSLNVTAIGCWADRQALIKIEPNLLMLNSLGDW